KIEVQTQLTGESCAVMGDTNQLLQVCLLFAQQALQDSATGGGTLTIRSFVKQRWAAIEFIERTRSAPDGALQPGPDQSPADAPGEELSLSAFSGIIQEHQGRIFREIRPDGTIVHRIEIPLAPAQAKRAPQATGDAALPPTLASARPS